MTLLPLLGVLVGVVGFAARINPLLVVMAAAIVSYAVIKAQLPTAFLLLAANTVLMYALVFH
jgi:uncharacterized membrane protein